MNNEYFSKEDLKSEAFEEYTHTFDFADYLVCKDDLEELIATRNDYITKNNNRKSIGKWLEEHPKTAIAIATGAFTVLGMGTGIPFIGALVAGGFLGLGSWSVSTIFFKKIYTEINKQERTNTVNKYKKESSSAEQINLPTLSKAKSKSKNKKFEKTFFKTQEEIKVYRTKAII